MSSNRPFDYMHLLNFDLIETLYREFLKDPKSVDPTWRAFFEGMEFGEYLKKRETAVPKERGDGRIFNLIEAYRRFGHLQADINPIATQKPKPAEPLLLKSLGFEDKDLATSFPTMGLLNQKEAPLEKIIEALKETYSGTKAIEYMCRNSPELEKWIQKQIEPTHFKPNFTSEQKKEILRQLNKAETFETFLHTKYVGQKRFSLEGGETLIPILSEIIEKGSEMGMDEFVLGMAHRGRLNVLTNILNKSYSMVFGEFEDYVNPNLVEGSGDVKYHKGYSSNVETKRGKRVHISLSANPSHLESVNVIVEGRTRAKQVYRKDLEKKKVVPILIHGDASIAGQGIVYETLQFYNIEGYGNGGTLHIIINNQIGFTTLPFEYRSTLYCSDIAKGFDFPVFHVNAEDPEGCVYATNLAIQIRQLFHIDVFIVLNCYRKYGHNESDEPAFTQPLEYQLIRQKKSIREIYRDQLVSQGVVEKNIALQLEEEFKKMLHYELDEMKIKKEKPAPDAFQGVWHEYRKASKEELFKKVDTEVDAALLTKIGEKFCEIPKGFEIHSKLKRFIEQRRQMAEGKAPLDWSMAEWLALGSLLWEGVPIRFSGQDSQRGTFSQRHAVWLDQKTGKRYFPLSHLKEDQGLFQIYNSPLSELGAIGFEWGYSTSYPSALVVWEAQFGDFANGAQVIFDQYLSCSEQKWQRYSGLTLLLPHGYEGQGSEHSSARPERFLQLAAEANIQVTYPTTPAQYFHLLRRQVLRLVRVPLIILTPKGLLRHPSCISSLKDLSEDTFQEVLDDKKGMKKATRLLLCSGRIYYDLVAEREKRKRNDTAIIRIEQLYPLHFEKLIHLLEKYKNVSSYFWVQEEPLNMGGFSYMHPILQELLSKKDSLQYIGRKRSAATAAGSHALHEKEQKELMERIWEA